MSQQQHYLPWVCSSCSFTNPESRGRFCSMCGTARSSSGTTDGAEQSQTATTKDTESRSEAKSDPPQPSSPPTDGSPAKQETTTSTTDIAGENPPEVLDESTKLRDPITAEAIMSSSEEISNAKRHVPTKSSMPKNAIVSENQTEKSIKTMEETEEDQNDASKSAKGSALVEDPTTTSSTVHNAEPVSKSTEELTAQSKASQSVKLDDQKPESPNEDPPAPVTAKQNLGNQKKMVLLISSMPKDFATQTNITRLQTIVHGLGFPTEGIETIDGCDTSMTHRRNELFSISGMRAKYPQLFVQDGTHTKFIGEFEDIQGLVDSGALMDMILHGTSDSTQPSEKEKEAVTRATDEAIGTTSKDEEDRSERTKHDDNEHGHEEAKIDSHTTKSHHKSREVSLEKADKSKDEQSQARSDDGEVDTVMVVNETAIADGDAETTFCEGDEEEAAEERTHREVDDENAKHQIAVDASKEEMPDQTTSDESKKEPIIVVDLTSENDEEPLDSASAEDENGKSGPVDEEVSSAILPSEENDEKLLDAVVSHSAIAAAAEEEREERQSAAVAPPPPGRDLELPNADKADIIETHSIREEDSLPLQPPPPPPNDGETSPSVTRIESDGKQRTSTTPQKQEQQQEGEEGEESISAFDDLLIPSKGSPVPSPKQIRRRKVGSSGMPRSPGRKTRKTKTKLDEEKEQEQNESIPTFDDLLIPSKGSPVPSPKQIQRRKVGSSGTPASPDRKTRKTKTKAASTSSKRSSATSPSQPQKPLMDLRHILKKHDKESVVEKPVTEVDFYGSMSAIPFLKKPTEKKKKGKKPKNQGAAGKKSRKETEEEALLAEGGERNSNGVVVVKDYTEEDVRMWKSMSALEVGDIAGEKPPEMLPLRPTTRPKKEKPSIDMKKHAKRSHHRPDEWLSPQDLPKDGKAIRKKTSKKKKALTSSCSATKGDEMMHLSVHDESVTSSEEASRKKGGHSVASSDRLHDSMASMSSNWSEQDEVYKKMSNASHGDASRPIDMLPTSPGRKRSPKKAVKNKVVGLDRPQEWLSPGIEGGKPAFSPTMKIRKGWIKSDEDKDEDEDEEKESLKSTPRL